MIETASPTLKKFSIHDCCVLAAGIDIAELTARRLAGTRLCNQRQLLNRGR